MQYDFGRKAVVVTGAGGMLGTALCERLISSNAIAIAWDNNDISLKHLKQRVAKNSAFAENLITNRVDICDELQVQDAHLRILDQGFIYKALINNAANNPKVENSDLDNSNILKYDMESWKNDIDVGLTGAFNCSRFIAPTMIEMGESASILNVSSDLGLIAPNHSIYQRQNAIDDIKKPVSYSVVKHGLNGLTKYFATYWTASQFRCNAICPGGIYNSQDEEFLSKLEALIPLGRMAELNEIVEVALFLISDAASYINGALVPVDGGRSTW